MKLFKLFIKQNRPKSSVQLFLLELLAHQKHKGLRNGLLVLSKLGFVFLCVSLLTIRRHVHNVYIDLRGVGLDGFFQWRGLHEKVCVHVQLLVGANKEMYPAGSKRMPKQTAEAQIGPRRMKTRRFNRMKDL